MASLNQIKIPLSATVGGNLPDNIHGPVNDVYIALQNLIKQLNDSGPVMLSPNGHFWKATISNVGAITWTDVGTVRP